MMTLTARRNPSGTWLRLATYNTVGAMGIALQQGVLVALIEGVGVHYLLATACAVLAAILHNFVWHDRWTWGDRAEASHRRWWHRLARFLVVNATVAIVGQVAFTAAYVAAFDLHYTLANLLAIATGSVVSYLANDRFVFRTSSPKPVIGEAVRRSGIGAAAVSTFVFATFTTPAALAAELSPDTLKAWTTYVEATERRIAGELDSAERFLVHDFETDDRVTRDTLINGDMHIEQMATRGRDGHALEIPRGAVHHWRGSIFVPGVTLDELLAVVRTPLAQKDLQEDVLESRVLERRPDEVKVFLKLRRKKFVTVHYNTEHLMRYVRHDDTRASSRSVATRIAELDQAGTSREKEKPIGNDRGFLWRLNSYWRYQQVPGGVIVECESVSLSRGIPSIVRWMVAPMIRSAAHESMERTLTSMKTRLLASRAAAQILGDDAEIQRPRAGQ